MEYTAYKFQPSFIEERLKSYKSNLMKFKGHDDLVGNAVRVIRERLESDPRRYLSYGPYWWAIKKVLVDNGVPLGKVDDEEVRLAYTGTTDEETIVMAEEFRNDCLGNMKLYTAPTASCSTRSRAGGGGFAIPTWPRRAPWLRRTSSITCASSDAGPAAGASVDAGALHDGRPWSFRAPDCRVAPLLLRVLGAFSVFWVRKRHPSGCVESLRAVS